MGGHWGHPVAADLQPITVQPWQLLFSLQAVVCEGNGLHHEGHCRESRLILFLEVPTRPFPEALNSRRAAPRRPNALKGNKISRHARPYSTRKLVELNIQQPIVAEVSLTPGIPVDYTPRVAQVIEKAGLGRAPNPSRSGCCGRGAADTARKRMAASGKSAARRGLPGKNPAIHPVRRHHWLAGAAAVRMASGTQPAGWDSGGACGAAEEAALSRLGLRHVGFR